MAEHASPPGHVSLFGEPDWEWRRAGPSERAVRELGARHDGLRRLPGGAGLAWTDGRLVLKPVGTVEEHTWVCEVFAAWTATTVRVPEPIAPRGHDGGPWSVDGWGAHVLLPGRDAELLGEVEEVREASDRFHDAIRDLQRPAFIDERDDPWSYGDRLAWEHAEPDGDTPTLRMIERLRSLLWPVGSPSQVIHGDVLPNVLLHDRLVPGIIDWPPYFRPAAFAAAVAVTDAATFRQAPLAMLDDWATGPDWDQLLVRSVLYRLGPTGVFARRGRLMGNLVTHVERVSRVVAALEERLGGARA